MIAAALENLRQIVGLGGPAVALLLVLSVVALAVVLAKRWQLAAFGHGRHATISAALAEWDAGHRSKARATIAASRNHLAPILARAMDSGGQPAIKTRFEAEAEARLVTLEGGFRLLDLIAQIAPLLGLLGTVLGMIDAFRALQTAGDAVNPSALAGGIWVALR